MIAKSFRTFIYKLRLTPLHPQWFAFRYQIKKERDVSNKASGKILDVGCASRKIEKQLNESCEYIGLDNLYAGQVMYSSSPDVIADAHTLPFSSNTFDTIILMEVAEHLNSPSTALKEVKRVLKPGGEIIFTVPYIYPTHDAPYDYQRWTQYGLENIAKESGLSINSIINYGEPIETGTLIFCLGLSFQTLNLLKRRHPLGLIMLILAIIIIPIFNIVGWLLSQKSSISENQMPIGFLALFNKPND